MEQGVFGRLMLSCGISAKPTADCCSIVSHPALCLHTAVKTNMCGNACDV